MTCQRNFSIRTWYWTYFLIFNLHKRTVYHLRYITSVILMKTRGLKMKQLDTIIEKVWNLLCLDYDKQSLHQPIILVSGQVTLHHEFT